MTTGSTPSRRSSVAQTMSPASSAGAAPAHRPTTATAGASIARPRAAAIRPLAVPAGRREREHRPGRLRRRGPAPAAPLRLAVGTQVLAEPAVAVLHPLEPGDGASHAFVLGHPAGGKPRHDSADAVD